MGERINRFWKRVNDYGNDETRDPISHSNAYHKHFQGYAERKVSKGNDKGTKIERVYVADYYRYRETDRVWKLKKLLHFFLFIIAVAAILFADSRPIAINSIPAIGISEILSIIPLVWLSYGLIMQLTAARMMTIGERESANIGFRKASLVCTVYIMVLSAAMLAAKLMTFGGVEPSDWTAICPELVGGLLLLTIYLTERARNIEKIPNDTEVPEDANEIW